MSSTLPADRQSRAWETFSGSDIQRVLHGYLADDIETCRTQLESAEGPEAVIRIQATILTLRRLLAEIHHRDNVEVRTAYAQNRFN